MANIRFDNIDIARGLAMLVVIEWHTLGEHGPFTDGWAMPVFFFIMGVFYKQPAALKDVITKKAKGLLLPLLVYSVPALVILLFTKPFNDTVKHLINPYASIHGVTWFLLCTFWCYVLSYFVHKYIKSAWYILTAFLFISLVGYYTGQWHIGGHRIVLPFYISTAMTAFGFVEIGGICKKYVLLIQKNKYKHLLISMLAYIVGVILFSPKESSYIWNPYNNTYFPLLYNGVAGSVFVISLSSFLPSILSYFGKYSLLLLLIHPYMITLLSLFLSGWILYIGVVASTFLFSLFCSRYLPAFSGLKK